MAYLVHLANPIAHNNIIYSDMGPYSSIEEAKADVTRLENASGKTITCCIDELKKFQGE